MSGTKRDRHEGDRREGDRHGGEGTGDASPARGGEPAPGFAVLLDGPMMPGALLRERAAGLRAIAADGGMRHAAPLGLMPELWVGDFDGAPADLAPAWADVPRETHPVAKDATDGELALRAALGRGAGALLVVGALGGPRLDHALGTLALGLALAGEARGGGAAPTIVMTDGAHWAHPLLPGRPLSPDPREGAVLSIVALDALEGLDVEGVAWPLTDASVPAGSSRTLSNRVVGTPRIALRAGRGLAVLGPGDR